jgi:hypothetical protein
VRAAELELDLDVFAGPFDLLLTLILREEIDLMEVDLAGIVLAYLDHLEARGELDLEVATEFLVLIAALLELKSRLLLPRDGDEELFELEPGEAAEELLARMLQARQLVGWPRRAATATAARRRPRTCAVRRWGPPWPSTTPLSWGPRSARCCAIRRRSTSTTCTLCTRACRWRRGWRTCGGCCAVGRSRSTRRCTGPTG